MVRRSVHKLLRTWFGLLINVFKSEESACAAFSLKEGASSGRNPPRLARQMKLSRQLRFRSLEYPHQAGHHLTDRRHGCYLVKGFLRHPSLSESSQGV